MKKTCVPSTSTVTFNKRKGSNASEKPLVLKKQRSSDTDEWTNKIPISKFPRYEYASAQLCSINKRHNKVTKSSNTNIELFTNDVYLTTCPADTSFTDINKIIERDNINAGIPKIIVIVLNKVPTYDLWYRVKRHNVIIRVDNDTICKATKLAWNEHITDDADKIKVVTKEAYYREIDLLLERIVFRNLKNLLLELERLLDDQVCSTLSSDSSLQNVSVIKRLIGDIHGVFYRSNVPDSERPNTIVKRVNEKMLQTLSARLKAFRGCGYRNGTLHIYVSESNRKDKEIGAILQEYNIHDYTKSVISSTEPYSHVGAVVKTRVSQENFGTLGGFAFMGHDKKLCALVSKHVVKGAKELFFVGENKSPIHIGKILEASEDSSGGKIDIDVAAAMIQGRQVKYDTWFKDSSRRQKDARLFKFTEDTDYKIDWLRNLPVHIYGAATGLGRGTIIVPEIEDLEMKHMLIVEDIEDMLPPDTNGFSAPGDSGAIICADDPNGECVHVIAMLMGERCIEDYERTHVNRKEYMSVRLTTGLQKLGEETGEPFTLWKSV